MARTASSTRRRPASLEERLNEELSRLVGGPLQGKRMNVVSRALAALHARFVSELPQTEASTYMDDAASRAAYLAYFFPASRAQVARALAEVKLPKGRPLRVLDLGSGPGPASVAVAEWAAKHSRSVELVAADTSGEAADTLRRLWSPSWGELETRAWSAGQPLPEGTFDVIVLAHVLNELFPGDPHRLEKRSALMKELAARLSPDGLLVLVEPALRRTGRELLVLRDRLVSHGLSVQAPCFFQGSCPAIIRPRDWCHSDRPWKPPALLEKIGDEAGLARESLKFAYVILSRGPADQVRSKDTSLFRIVSERLPEKGKLRYFGCGAAGRHPLVRLDREASETNAAFDRLDRGDVIRVGALVASGDGRRLGADTDVQVEQRAVGVDREAE